MDFMMIAVALVLAVGAWGIRKASASGMYEGDDEEDLPRTYRRIYRRGYDAEVVER